MQDKILILVQDLIHVNMWMILAIGRVVTTVGSTEVKSIKIF